jgi:hypothetical protein
MDEKLTYIQQVVDKSESSFDRALLEILVDYKNKINENELWKEETFLLMKSMEKDCDQEFGERGSDCYVEPPVVNMEYYEACYENQGAIFVKDRLTEELLAMYEMQIIYSFKQIEISLKLFVKILEKNSESSIDPVIIKGWDDLKGRLKPFGVRIGIVLGYSSVNQLRMVNNALKHSHKVTEDIKKNKIKEFAGLDYFTPESLDLFHSDFIKHKSVFINNVAYLVGKSMKLSPEELHGFKNNSVYEEDMEGCPF